MDRILALHVTKISLPCVNRVGPVSYFLTGAIHIGGNAIIKLEMKLKRKVVLFAIAISFLQSYFYSFGLASFGPNNNQRIIQHEVTVTLKLVQVYVTDKQGKPVMDLRKDDFELFDNGKSQPITDFEKHELFLPEKKTKETLPANQVPQLRMNRKFFLLFDFAFNNAPGIEQSKKAALHFVDRLLLPTDEVGILSYSRGKGLTLHEFLTTNHNKVREVVEGFGLKNILGRAQDVESAYWSSLQTMTGELSLTNPDRARAEKLLIEKQKLKEATIDRLLYQLDVRNFVSQMSDLAKALRYIPGYKSVIFFSSGIASSVFQGPPIAIDRSELAASYWTKGTLYNINSLDAAIWEEKKYVNMIKEFSSSNSPVYVLNTDELTAQDFSKNKAMSGEYSLKKIAEISGGKYFPYVHNYETIGEEIQILTGSYYVLGYYVDEKWDGKYNEIKIKVKRKGCRVQAQSGYFNPKPFQKFSDFEKKLHLIDLALSEKPQFQRPGRFPLIVLQCLRESDTLLLLLSEIPIEEMKEVGNEKIEIVTLILNNQKNIVIFKRKETRFSLIAQNRAFHYTFSLLPPGEYECRVVIRNLETGKGAVGSSSIFIRETCASGLSLSEPLLLIPDQEAYYLETSDAETQGAEGKPLSLIKIYPFNYSQNSPIVGELKKPISKILGIVRYSVVGIPEAEVSFSASLMRPSLGQGIELPFSIISVEKQESEEKTVILLMEFQFRDLEAGEYFLSLSAEELSTKTKDQVTTLLRVY